MPIAVVATGFGGPEVLSQIDVPVQEPGPGEVAVRVDAAGVNPVDYKLYSGSYGTDPSQLPMRLGFEAAGEVTAVGDNATGPAGPVSVGDEVIVYRASGAYAEHLLAAADQVLPRPQTLSTAQAAGLMLAGVTAVHTLTATSVGHGDTVLVHAAAGGVGLMIVQLARARGARVIGTAGDAQHQLLRDLGAEPVTYGEGLADRVRALAPDGVQAAVDAVGTDEAIDVSLELIADRGRIATIAAFERGSAEGIKVLGNGPGGDPGDDIRDAARLELVQLADDGKLTVTVAKEFPLAQARDAHLLVRDGHAHGKVVLLP